MSMAVSCPSLQAYMATQYLLPVAYPMELFRQPCPFMKFFGSGLTPLDLVAYQSIKWFLLVGAIATPVVQLAHKVVACSLQWSLLNCMLSSLLDAVLTFMGLLFVLCVQGWNISPQTGGVVVSQMDALKLLVLQPKALSLKVVLSNPLGDA